MFCNNCGYQLPDGTKFCNNCGKPTTAPQTPVMNNQIPPEQQPLAHQQQPVMQQTPIYASAPQPGYAQPNAGYPLPPIDYSPIVTPPPKKKSKTPFIILGVVAALVLVVIIGIITSGSSFTPEHGTIDGNIYTNESIGIQFEKPDSWVFATDEALADMHDGDVSASDYDDMVALLEENQYVQDMFVQSPIGSTATVAFEDISADPSITYEEYLDNSEDFVGTSIELGEMTDKTIAGKEFKMIEASASTMGIDIPLRYYLRKEGNYMILICTGGISEAALDEIEDMFSEIE